ncbi:MAG: hypothetical protein HQ592_17875 [Planctomycetes bacterium]|nr:hypothetical protein [Planctomycetota bacterium]
MNSTKPLIGKTVVKAEGILEGPPVDLLRSALAGVVETRGHVIVDLSSVEAMADDAMDALREAAAALDRIGSRLLIMNASTPAPRMTDFRKLQEHLETDRMPKVKTDGRVAVGT